MRTDSLERFWAKVDKSSECWIWTGARTHDDYGRFQLDGKARLAHRVISEHIDGPLADGECVLHHCDNPPCVRPQHLFRGTQEENVADRQRKGRTARGERHGRTRNPKQTCIGEENGRAKITAAQARSIRNRYAEGDVSMRRLAVLHGLSPGTICKIVNGDLWKETQEQDDDDDDE